MAIKVMKERGSSASSIARTRGVTEGAMGYHLRRQAEGTVDGRDGNAHCAYDGARSSDALLGRKSRSFDEHEAPVPPVAGADRPEPRDRLPDRLPPEPEHHGRQLGYRPRDPRRRPGSLPSLP
jgi:hypothetical protein